MSCHCGRMVVPVATTIWSSCCVVQMYFHPIP
jgi:hypothetical protein